MTKGGQCFAEALLSMIFLAVMLQKCSRLRFPFGGPVSLTSLASKLTTPKRGALDAGEGRGGPFLTPLERERER